MNLEQKSVEIARSVKEVVARGNDNEITGFMTGYALSAVASELIALLPEDARIAWLKVANARYMK